MGVWGAYHSSHLREVANYLNSVISISLAIYIDLDISTFILIYSNQYIFNLNKFVSYFDFCLTENF